MIFEVDEGLLTLLDFKYNRVWRENGESGRGKEQYGRGADDVVVKCHPGRW